MTDTVQDIQANILEAKNFVEIGEALTRLEDSRDFKLLVSEGYFKAEAIRLVECLADPAFQTKDRQASLVTDMAAISGFKSYLRMVRHRQSLALATIKTGQEEIEAIHAEEAEAAGSEA